MQFDPRSPEFRADPYPFYEILRAYAPIFFWEPWGLYFLSSYEDCQSLLRDDRLGHLFIGEVPPQQQSLWDMQRNWLLVMNPPDHTRLRSLVHKAFTPRTVARLRDTVQKITDDLIDAVKAKGELELIADLAYPLPVAVICEMLGVPQADHVQFQGWSADIIQSLDLVEDEGVYNRASAAAAELKEYFGELLENRRRSPQDDLISALVAVEEEGDKLTKDELFGTCSLLLMAGHETTVNLIGNGVHALLNNPDQWQRLKLSPELIPSAVEELLRYDSPVQFTSRVVLEQIEYKGHIFEEGTGLGFLLGAANRDPDQFTEPARLDIGRPSNKHLAFGGGIHYCLGAPLARLEGEIAFATVARRLPELSLVTDQLTYRDNYTLRGLEKLPLEF